MTKNLSRFVASPAGLDPMQAAWDGQRSIRLLLPDGSEIGLATATYSYALSHEERMHVARRFAAMWNACRTLSTEQIEAACRPVKPQ